MLITILADASWCPDTRVAGYGYWIASDRGSEGGGGVMTTRQVASNTVAEMMALANALHHAMLLDLVQADDSILFQTDCIAAILGFTGKRMLALEQERLVNAYMRRSQRMLNLEFEYRHVKGHTRSREARFLANNHCDAQARSYMRQARMLFVTEGLAQ